MFSQDTVCIIIDEPVSKNLPRNFRKSDGELIRPHQTTPDTAGLRGLDISGSAEFSAYNLPVMAENIGRSFIVVDLRQETHFLVNGITISWYGRYDWADLGLSRAEILALESKRMDSVKNLKQLQVRRVIKKDKSTDTFLEFKDTTLNVESVQSEDELAGSTGNKYLRLTCPDHRRPQTEEVDRFIGFVNSIRTGSHLHFHCHAGDGRTTTFMVMYDMMRNAKYVTYEDITMRQFLLGGIDLNKDEDFPEWEKKYAFERTEFLMMFYRYCRDNTDEFKTNFTAWMMR